ncbi:MULTISPECIES: carboxymuconolactone decarboxylase family protein [Glycomyces]|uniref:Carboxymuconolactone decarboxylase family protein n=1 Tax=Glycomyces lechevalierae TaxID=256034 RepID=A0A9X3PHN9_9ACTN|nr:carboxymuconolactone decarboxylase family protein [Glycomyces lechevalierae]MDA1384184.1 carboxymuconolactone decarboxylase family protein [Glycomyces lechevalierae]MDR7339386.1 alkylhydroperoxidase/carboxymuconolactone decarboxylase family protein YurZ [Glycomyces lechevalierae]
MSQEPARAQQLMGEVAPELVEPTDEVLFSDAWKRPGLSSRDRSLITVAVLVALHRGARPKAHRTSRPTRSTITSTPRSASPPSTRERSTP